MSIAILSAGSERYYLRSAFDAIDEYYVKGEEQGRWMGSGGRPLDLSAAVASEDLQAVLGARSPIDGQELVGLRAALTRTRPGFDLTFSAPKGVSVPGLLGGPELASEVFAAHDNAVSQALDYLESHAAFVRRGHAGATLEPAAGLIGAGFVHVTSRAGDPQLHTHLLVANLAQGPEGNWSALDSRALYRHSRTPASSTRPLCAPN